MTAAIKRRLPSPRAAIVGFDDETASSIAELVRSPLIATEVARLGNPWDEIDVVISGEDLQRVPWDLSCLLLARETPGILDQVYSFFPTYPHLWSGYSDALEIEVPELEPEALHAAAHRLADSFPDASYQMFRFDRIEHLRSFVTNPRGEVLAGEYRRGERSVGWVVPWYTLDIREWARLFLQAVSNLDPSRVPVAPPAWDPWRSAKELEILGRRDQLTDEYSRVVGEMRQALFSIDEELAAAALDNERTHGVLLTGEGDALKLAVVGALTAVGFEVEDVDAALPAGQGKREDLWVRSPGREGVAIVEIKGYRKGARSGDLVATIHYAGSYAERTKSRPARQWHIVNANRSQDPSVRPRLFKGADDVVSAYGGLVMDTRDLFRLVRAVESGAITAEEARGLLWDGGPGHFVYEPP